MHRITKEYQNTFYTLTPIDCKLFRYVILDLNISLLNDIKPWQMFSFITPIQFRMVGLYTGGYISELSFDI